MKYTLLMNQSNFNLQERINEIIMNTILFELVEVFKNSVKNFSIKFLTEPMPLKNLI